MPLTYHGRLKKKTIARPSRALEFGEQYFADSSPQRTIDLRLAWESVDGLTACASLLPDDYDAFWMDIAAHIDVDSYAQIDSWIRRFHNGHISLICLKDGFETEIRFTLPDMGPLRYDDDRYARSVRKSAASIAVRTSPLASGINFSRDAQTFAAHRVETAFNILKDTSSTPAPDYADWLRTHFDEDSPVHNRTTGSELSDEPIYRSSGEVPRYAWSDLEIHCLSTEGVPADLNVVFKENDKATALDIFFRFAAALPQIDVVVIRTVGPLQSLLNTLDQVDLFGFHPQRRNHLYGLSTRHGNAPLPKSTLDSILQSKALLSGLADWDVAWSNLHFELSMLEPQTLGTSQSTYVVRSDAAKSTDKLVIHLDIEDPQDPNFRGARRELSAQLGGDIARENSWSYEGNPISTPLGQAHVQLADALKQELSNVMMNPSKLDPSPGRHWVEHVPFFGKKRVDEQEFTSRLSELIRKALPGFQYDRKAHITDQYYLEFVRRTASGYQMIEVQRFYRPLGFTVRFGVARYRIPFQDLVPATHKAIPGFRFELNDVAPERPERWNYRSLRGLTMQFEDLAHVLERRVRHVFNGAHEVLEKMNNEEESR